MIEGQCGDEHARALLEGIVGPIKNRHTDGKAVGTAVPLEICCKCHVVYGKGGYAVLFTITVDSVIEDFRESEAQTSAHGTDCSAVDGFQNRRFICQMNDLFPVCLITGMGLGFQVLLLFLHMECIVRCRRQIRRFPGKQIQIGSGNLIAQHDLGPAVGNNVMQFYQNAAAGFGILKQDKAV